jgi:hypothetical protein
MLPATVSLPPPEREAGPRPARLRSAAALGLLLAATFVVPLALRLVHARGPARPPVRSYLPSLEAHRERQVPFEASRISDLQRLDPGVVVIGDSMAGTRIDERRLGQLAGRPVAPLLQPGSGPAFWYLALKNWVIASGITPRVVFIFFRDTNLTDVMFRLDEQYRWSLDLVASDDEAELDAVIAARARGPFHRLHGGIASIYQADRVRERVEPALTAWPAGVMIPSRRRRTAFMSELNARFSLDHLRPMEAADIQAVEDRSADFARHVGRSVLPLMLRDARRAGLTLCLVRVQRRPIDRRPPAQSAALQQYVGELRAYVESAGAVFRDDTGDPALTLDMYEDGDHVARHARAFYTEVFFRRLRPLLQ